MSQKIFGAYDIRGRYPQEVNGEVVALLGQVLGNYLKRQASGRRRKIIVGHDVRLSSPGLYRALLKGLKPSQLKIIKVGLVTTPMLYFLAHRLQALAGLMVTASHNPANYNGLKLVDKNGNYVSGVEILKILKNELS